MVVCVAKVCLLPSRPPPVPHLFAASLARWLVVRLVSGRPAFDPGLSSWIFFPRKSHTSDTEHWYSSGYLTRLLVYRVSAGTGWPGVSILWLGEIDSLSCNFRLSVAARTIVWADPSCRYTGMLPGRLASKKPNQAPFFVQAPAHQARSGPPGHQKWGRMLRQLINSFRCCWSKLGVGFNQELHTRKRCMRQLGSQWMKRNESERFKQLEFYRIRYTIHSTIVILCIWLDVWSLIVTNVWFIRYAEGLGMG